MSSMPFFMADYHLGHKLMVTGIEEDGTKLRPFDTVEEMNEFIIESHNKVVGPSDKIYMLGDIVFGKSNLHLLSRLNGDKILISGNHDLAEPEVYKQYFRAVRALWKISDFVMTHVPVHPQSVTRWKDGNIHGHLHKNVVLDIDKNPDPRYICVSAERLEYKPIRFDEIEKLRYKKK